MNAAQILVQTARARQLVVKKIEARAKPSAIHKAEIERDETLAFLMSDVMAVRTDYSGACTEADLLRAGFSKEEVARCGRRAVQLTTEEALRRNLDVFHYA